MKSEARLQRALAAERAPRRDPSFTLAVMREAEARRFRLQTANGVLRSVGIAVAGSAILVPLAGWAGSDPAGLQDGVLAAAGLIGLVAGARLMAARAGALLRR
ncbi:MAG TPA: hypothetical protein VEA80_11360 [Vitreimonas sp.]|uniref:hypothetical protein n=1 Tax=Vitreimonas sp. TaxID=3069702 RepID=UPI002D5972FC|nr:hypothetical protein [Vitreimonas sp.]HYD88065.1 hypothetical protein [Vitreimonas sp.]